jgi:predicted transcriptional regulator
MSQLTPTDSFDELTAIVRFLLYVKSHPKAGITEIIKGTPAGQRAIYSAKDYAEKNKLIETTLKTTSPYGPQYSLTEKGKKVAVYLEEIQKLLEH